MTSFPAAVPASPPRLVALQRLRGLTIAHHLEPGGALWASAGRAVLRLAPEGHRDLWGRFPFVARRDLLGFTRPAARALRADKCNVYVNQADQVLGIRSGQVYHLQAGGPPHPLFPIQGDSVLHGGICEDDQGWTYFGEYFMNPGRGPVRIYRLSPGLDRWEVAHEFHSGSVRHVHGVYRDPYDSQALWVATGDNPGECHFYRTRDRFASLERFGDGSQLWRAVRLYFTPDHITWLTDSPLEQNYACRISRPSPGKTETALERGQLLDASAWYGAQTQDGWYLGFTTVEPGPAIHTDRSSLLVSRDAFYWQVAATWLKDFWRPMKVFKYGVVSCPSGAMHSTSLYFSGEGLVGLDGCTLHARLEPPA